MLRCPASPYMIVMVSTTTFERARTRPERDHEADRDDLEPAAGQHVVERGGDHPVDRRLGEQPRGQVQHLRRGTRRRSSRRSAGRRSRPRRPGRRSAAAATGWRRTRPRRPGRSPGSAGMRRTVWAMTDQPGPTRTRSRGRRSRDRGRLAPRAHLFRVGVRPVQSLASRPQMPAIRSGGRGDGGVRGEVVDEGGQVVAAADPVGALGEHGERVAAVGQEAVGDDPVRRVRVERLAVQRDARRVDPAAERTSRGCR